MGNPTPKHVSFEPLRRLMAKKAVSRRTRLKLPFTRELPTHWSPTTIINPRTGIPFTDESAWDLIATTLEHETDLSMIQLTVMNKPQGVDAIEMLADIDPQLSFVYMKVHMGARDKVVGRSFHLSDWGRSKWTRN